MLQKHSGQTANRDVCARENTHRRKCHAFVLGEQSRQRNAQTTANGGAESRVEYTH